MELTYCVFSMSSMHSGRCTLSVSGSRKATDPQHTATPQYVTSGRDLHTSSSRNTRGAKALLRCAMKQVYPIPSCLEKVGHHGGADHHERWVLLSYQILGKNADPLTFPLFFSLSAEVFFLSGFSSARLFLGCWFGLAWVFMFVFFLHIFLQLCISQTATTAAVRNMFASIMRKNLQLHTKNTCSKLVSAFNV